MYTIYLCDADAQDFVSLLIWRGIDFSVSYDYSKLDDVVITSNNYFLIEYNKGKNNEN